MKQLGYVACGLLLSVMAFAQKTKSFQASPGAVMEEIFRAAKQSDYSNLTLLCPPDASNDGDTRWICEIANARENDQVEFASYFSQGYLNGDIRYSAEEGRSFAIVPFWFNHPSGGDRCKEEMRMVKIGEKWYLISF